MTTTEQILIRMGVDAKAVVVGLNAVTLTIKSWSSLVSQQIKDKFAPLGKNISGWGKEFGNEMKGMLGRFLVAGIAVEKLNEVKNEIIEIKRLSDETGAGTNFIQSLMLEAAKSGTSVEALTMPLIFFNRQIGQAAMGAPAAQVKIHDLGISLRNSAGGVISFSDAMKQLKVSYDKIGEASKRDALLFDAFGRGAFRMAPIFKESSKDFDKMFQGNFFTRISTSTIDNFQAMWNGVKIAGQVTMSTLVNSINIPLKAAADLSQKLGIMSTGVFNPKKIAEIQKEIQKNDEGIAFQKSLQNQADQEGIDIQQEKNRITEEYNSLLERQRELKGDIDDRDKMTISQMAADARRKLGIPEPRNYTVSARQREALRIDTLEKQASIAFEKGDDKKFKSLRSEADQARAGFAGGTYKDKNPLSKTESELSKVNLQLEPLKRMADLINSEHK